jgi:hypothetical protein
MRGNLYSFASNVQGLFHVAVAKIASIEQNAVFANKEVFLCGAFQQPDVTQTAHLNADVHKNCHPDLKSCA